MTGQAENTLKIEQMEKLDFRFSSRQGSGVRVLFQTAWRRSGWNTHWGGVQFPDYQVIFNTKHGYYDFASEMRVVFLKDDRACEMNVLKVKQITI